MVATATADLENIVQEASEMFDSRFVRQSKRIDCILTVLDESEEERELKTKKPKRSMGELAMQKQV